MLKQGKFATYIWSNRREIKCSPDIYWGTDAKFALPITIGRNTLRTLWFLVAFVTPALIMKGRDPRLLQNKIVATLGINSLPEILVAAR